MMEAEWRRRIEAGQVFLNGLPALPDGTLTRGDTLLYHRPPWDEPDAPTDFAVLFEDEDVLALAKPSGLPVLPGGFFLENTLLYLVRRRFGAASSPLHRLGRGTSGAILFTRNPRSARSLAKAMFDRRILKVYLALASGTSMTDAFTVDAPIGPVPLSASPDRQRLSSRRPSVDEPRPSPPSLPRQERFACRSDHPHGTSPSDPDPSQLRRVSACRRPPLSGRRPSPFRWRRRRMDHDPGSDGLSLTFVEDPVPSSVAGRGRGGHLSAPRRARSAAMIPAI